MSKYWKKITGLVLVAVLVLGMGMECLAAEMPQNTISAEIPQNAISAEIPQNAISAEIPQNTISATPGIMDVNIPSTVELAAGIPQQQCGFIYVGDSRCVGLDMITGFSKEPCKWMVAKTAKGYNWLDTAAAEVDAIEASNPQITKWYEVYMFGLNDPGNMEKYAAWYSMRAPGHNIVLVSLNPIKYHGSITNEKIMLFNQTMMATGLPFIDCYTYLMTNGFDTSDGVHYTKNTYYTINSLLNSALSGLVK